MALLHAINAMEAEKLTARDAKEPAGTGLVINAMAGEGLIVIAVADQAKLSAKNVADQAKLSAKNVADRVIITARKVIDTIAVPVAPHCVWMLPDRCVPCLRAPRIP